MISHGYVAPGGGTPMYTFAQNFSNNPQAVPKRDPAQKKKRRKILEAYLDMLFKNLKYVGPQNEREVETVCGEWIRRNSLDLRVQVSCIPSSTPDTLTRGVTIVILERAPTYGAMGTDVYSSRRLVLPLFGLRAGDHIPDR